jgi:hypothetical protein
MVLSTMFRISLVTLYHPYFWHFPVTNFILFLHLDVFTFAEPQYFYAQNKFVF